MTNIEELEALLAKAQSPKLIVDQYFNIRTTANTPLKFTGIEIPMVHGPAQQQAKDNVSAYVALHNAAPALLAELKRLREEAHERTDRDARMKAEGAAEAWEKIAKIGESVTEMAIRVTAQYAREQAARERAK